MKVLVISHTYISPINRNKWNILAQNHPDVTIHLIFPTYWPGNLFNHHAKIEPHESLSNYMLTALDAFYTGNELLYGYKFSQLYTLIKTFKPDLIHVEQGAGAFSYFQTHLCTRLLRLKTKSVFFTWINWKPQYSLKHRLFLHPIEKTNLSHAHGAIAGNREAQELLQEKGFSRPILVLPQIGVDQSVFKPKDFVQQPLRRTKYVGYIGRLVEEKGIFLLLEAFAKLNHMFADWKLVFIGTGPAQKNLLHAIIDQQMTDRIELCKPVAHDKIALLLRNIDILVLPSYDISTWKEQFGHVLIEAMACSVPVIGSDAGAIAQVIGDAGLIFEQKNEPALRAQLQTLMSNEPLRYKLGEHGVQQVQSHYSHKAIAEKTYYFWRQLFDNPKQP